LAHEILANPDQQPKRPGGSGALVCVVVATWGNNGSYSVRKAGESVLLKSCTRGTSAVREVRVCAEEGGEMSDLFDVIAVNLDTFKVRLMVQGKTAANAEAIVKNAVLRRGVAEEFFVDVPNGTYAEGDTWGKK
jgi:hypothetical protein